MLLTEKLEPKITDFGLATFADSPENGGVTKADFGPVRIMAPEYLLQRKFSSKSDVWSFGLVMVEIWTRKEIYEGISNTEVIGLVCYQKEHHNIPQHIPALHAAVMALCWEFDANNRPSMKLIQQMLNRTDRNFEEKSL